MKILLQYIKKINIYTIFLLFILFPTQTKSESLNIFTDILRKIKILDARYVSQIVSEAENIFSS